MRFDAEGLWPAEVKALLRDEPQLTVSDAGRVVILPIEPQLMLGTHVNVERGKKWIKEGHVPGGTVGTEANAAAEGYALAVILHGLAQPNVVIEETARARCDQRDRPMAGRRAGEAPDETRWLAKTLANRAGADGPAAQGIARAHRPGRDAPRRARRDQQLLDRSAEERRRGSAPISTATWRGRAISVAGIDPGQAPLPADVVTVGSREWAFRRTERLSIAVGTPTLRGPFAAEAVPPASKLVLSESSLQEVVTFREEGSERSRLRTSESATFSSATFRQALSHMAEEGINSEAAFASDTTLFDSLRERRREAVERTLTQISSNNEQRSGVVARTVTSTARSYTTRGKDARFATTEVSFQVAAPVDVEIRLEDVGLVWCPRMRSPFIALAPADHELRGRGTTGVPASRTR